MRKFLPYILILVVLAGAFSFSSKASAQAAPAPTGTGTCFTQAIDTAARTITNGEQPGLTFDQCQARKRSGIGVNPTVNILDWRADGSQPGPVIVGGAAPTTPDPTKSEFEKQVSQYECGLGSFFTGGANSRLSGCVLQFVYWTFYTLGTWALYMAAHVFNYLIEITLSSSFLMSQFVSDAWATVRDLSNMFFILILLYIAIQIILDLHGHEAKKMIANVVIVALLINFSMFMTKVVIDTSNILALIFYNKVSVTSNIPGAPTARPLVDANGYKDVAGGLTRSFNPVYALDGNFYKTAGNVALPGGLVQSVPVSVGTLIGITLLAAAIMIFAAYALFVSGLSFLGRLIELFVLIIFSPFAFMSFSVPKLKSIDYIGWEAWFSRLIKVSFMAPIFMFFLYFIFRLLENNPFKDFAGINGSMIAKLMSLVIPSLVIMILLLKAVEFAKKGSGKFGEVVTTTAKVAGGLALGAATGGTALLATGTLGRFARNVANNDSLRAQAAGDKGHFAKMGITDINVQKKMQEAARKKIDRANYFAGSSFDLRQTGLGKFAASKTGMKFDNAAFGLAGMSTEKLKGGQKERFKKEAEKQETKIVSYQMTKRAAEEQDRVATPQNKIAEQYNKDRNEAKTQAEKRGESFNEATYKEFYKTMNGVQSVERVKTSKEVNEERRKAYTASLDKKNDEQAKVGLRKFGDEFLKGAGISTTTKTGLAASIGASVAAGIATGGVSLAAQIASGVARGGAQAARAGAANAIGEKTKSPFLAGLRETVRPYVVNPEVISKVRKEDPLKDLKELMHKENKGDHDKDTLAKGLAKHAGVDHGTDTTGSGSTPPASGH